MMAATPEMQALQTTIGFVTTPSSSAMIFAACAGPGSSRLESTSIFALVVLRISTTLFPLESIPASCIACLADFTAIASKWVRPSFLTIGTVPCVRFTLRPAFTAS